MQRVTIYAMRGNTQVSTGGVLSTTLVEGSFPSCTVSVFATGTTNLATIYGDNLNPPTPKSNPFTADSTGSGFFYAANGTRVDIQLSGTGIVTPFVLAGDVLLDDFSLTTISPPQTVTFSATPQFDLSQADWFQITLTGNVTAPTFPNASAGAVLIMSIIQDAVGSHTWAWPGSFTDPPAIAAAINARTECTFKFDGTTWTMLAATGDNLQVPGSTAIAGNVTIAGTTALNGDTTAAAGKVLKFSTDTGLSRDSAGVIDVGNGTQGDKSGRLRLDGGNSQINAILSVRNSTGGNYNQIEFGHSNQSGFGCCVGANSGDGFPWIAFFAEAGSTVNTFRTRGQSPVILKVTGASAGAIGTVASNNADNQAFSPLFNFNTSGTVTAPNATDTLVGKATTDVLTNKTLTAPVINGTPTGTGIPTATLKKGTGGGNYTSTSLTPVQVDGTNLTFTVTIPTGWKLIVHASGSVGSNTASVTVAVSIADGGTRLQEVTALAPIAGAAVPFSISWIITGDGASHTIDLRYFTTNAADAVSILNGSSVQLPTMTFLLTPSN